MAEPQGVLAFVSAAALEKGQRTAPVLVERCGPIEDAGMVLTGIPFQTIDWAQIARTTHAGERGTAYWRTVEVGTARVRRVEYSVDYLADHWCERGHVVHVLEGELVTELKDGRTFVSRTGDTYLVATGDGAHRSRSTHGVQLLIVD